jgi:glucose/arabinose dehydrogenase
MAGVKQMSHLGNRWLVSVLASSVLGVGGCDRARDLAVRKLAEEYVPAADAAGPSTGGSAGELDDPLGLGALPLRLVPVVGGLAQPTDLVFPPVLPGRLLVAEKEGNIRIFDLRGTAPRELRPLLSLPVLTESELGLLGVALHPGFGTTGGVMFVNATQANANGKAATRVIRYEVKVDGDIWTANSPTIILEVVQPYANHNAGQLAFGPDGMLYVGLGDGGWRDDPHDHGQDRATMLGSMLRIDVDRTDPGKAYAIPTDNPFLGQENVPPETWAVGLRNPWRYSFAPDGRLIVADVGQNAWEEVSIVGAGDNMGWRRKEGTHCFPAGETCENLPDLVDPVFEYPHQDGDGSITGGVVYQGARIPDLQGEYLFADFLSGRLRSLRLPAPGRPPLARSIGRWAILPSCFGRDADGEAYVADFGSGTVFRLEP